MKINKYMIVNLVAGCALIGGYQNCTATNFRSMSSESAKTTDVYGPDLNEGSIDLPIPGASPAPAQDGVDPRQTDSREVKCDSDLILAPIKYDVSDQSAPQNLGGGILSGPLDANHIGSLSNFSARDVLSVSAFRIDEIKSFALSQLSVNAAKIGRVSSGAAQKVTLVAHEVADPASLATHLCVSAHEVSSIGSSAGSFTVFGRGENGERSHLGSIEGAAGFIALYDLDVDSMSKLATNAKLTNVRLKSLKHGAGRIELYDSTIDDVSSFAGTITLHGSSSVDSRAGMGSVKIVDRRPKL